MIADDQAAVLGAKVPGLAEIGGVDVRGQLFNVFRVDCGRIVAVEDYALRAEALAAADAAPSPGTGGPRVRAWTSSTEIASRSSPSRRGALDDVLQRARERDDVEIESVQLGTPASAGPGGLPYAERPPAPPQRVPHPLPDGERN